MNIYDEITHTHVPLERYHGDRCSPLFFFLNLNLEVDGQQTSKYTYRFLAVAAAEELRRTSALERRNGKVGPLIDFFFFAFACAWVFTVRPVRVSGGFFVLD